MTSETTTRERKKGEGMGEVKKYRAAQIETGWYRKDGRPCLLDTGKEHDDILHAAIDCECENIMKPEGTPPWEVVDESGNLVDRDDWPEVIARYDGQFWADTLESRGYDIDEIEKRL